MSAARVQTGPLLIGLFAIAFGMSWSLAGRYLFARGLERQNEQTITQAVALFDYRATHVQDRLRGEARLMGEDPRLRSLLATPGISEDTILDLLREFAQLTGTHVLAVLAPTGKVISVVGQTSFEGLDLSTSKLIRDAREQGSPITGVWTLDREPTWVGVVAIRFGDRVVGYLVHGYHLEQHDLDAIHVATGADVAVVVAEQIARASPEDPALKPAFEQAARSTASGILRLDVGEGYLGRVRALEGSLPPTDLVWLRAAHGSSPEYEILGYLLWVPLLATFAFALMYGFQQSR